VDIQAFFCRRVYETLAERAEQRLRAAGENSN
jgi:hypothetical protein